MLVMGILQIICPLIGYLVKVHSTVFIKGTNYLFNYHIGFLLKTQTCHYQINTSLYWTKNG